MNIAYSVDDGKTNTEVNKLAVLVFDENETGIASAVSYIFEFTKYGLIIRKQEGSGDNLATTITTGIEFSDIGNLL